MLFFFVMYSCRIQQVWYFFKKKFLTFRVLSKKVIINLFSIFFMTACMTRIEQAPVINRSTFLGNVQGGLSSDSDSVPSGMVRVQSGDSLYQIALRTGRNWRDLAKWNGLLDPNLLEEGQLLRIDPGSYTSEHDQNLEIRSSNSHDLEKFKDSSFHDEASEINESDNVSQKNKKNLTKSESVLKKPNSSSIPGTFSVAGFIWPAVGEVKNTTKGIDILGKKGSAILAAAEGKVLYAGDGLRSYGNLIVLKHSNNWITAYGHNEKLLVKQGDSILKGQKIAEMGSSGTDNGKVRLYFEVRRISDEDEQATGKKKGVLVVDPLSVLPHRK